MNIPSSTIISPTVKRATVNPRVREGADGRVAPVRIEILPGDISLGCPSARVVFVGRLNAGETRARTKE
jgi:hypothetical protein